MKPAGNGEGGRGAVIRLAVCGAAGRMGARTCALARTDRRFELVAEIDLHGAVSGQAPSQVDVVVDFSSDDGARKAVELARAHGASLVVGTTGLSRQTQEALDVAASALAVMVAPNTSVGIAVMADLALRAARLLGGRYDVSLIEHHHAAKRDAPSGTAIRLAERLREAGVDLRPEAIHAVRGGDVVGEHVLEFSGPGERLRLAHLATSRDLFARGALRAAAWLCGRPPGRYTIEQALGGEGQGD